MYIYHVVRKNRQATIEIYWTTDSSWKNAALATKVLHPNCSSVIQVFKRDKPVRSALTEPHCPQVEYM